MVCRYRLAAGFLVSRGHRECLWSKVLSDTATGYFALFRVNENHDHRGVPSRNGNFSTLRRRRGTGAKNEVPEFN